MSAILIEDLGKCFDFSARRGSESPNRNTIAGASRTWMGVPTHGFVDDTVSPGGSDLPYATAVVAQRSVEPGTAPLGLIGR